MERPDPSLRYNGFNGHLRHHFGEKVFRVTINTGLTCPNVDGTKARGGCTFCQEASYLGLTFSENKSVREQIRESLSYMEGRHETTKALAFFQNGTNTYAPLDKLRLFFNDALAEENIVGLMIATRPDTLPEPVLDLLSELNEKTYLWVELGLQSNDNQILSQINRGHTFEEFEDCVLLLKKRNIRVGAHLILGIPGERPEASIEKAQIVNRLHIDGVKIHNLVIFKHTVMANQFQKGEIIPWSLEQYSKECVDLLEHLEPRVLIQRLNAHGPRRVTVAPEWSINKLATLNAVHDEILKRDTWQGKKLEGNNLLPTFKEFY